VVFWRRRSTAPNQEIFYKPVTCLHHPGDPILIPLDSRNLHYEGELVLMIGKKAHNVSGTRGKTAPMKAGHVTEVDIEGIGVPKGPLVAG
jgi:2-keto-4-pentenoate hydratase/2-oxohepta-3-ene-1,7-dioic acid hydratase in catechol pathway